jgi:hypothetical protein
MLNQQTQQMRDVVEPRFCRLQRQVLRHQTGRFSEADKVGQLIGRRQLIEMFGQRQRRLFFSEQAQQVCPVFATEILSTHGVD